MSETQALRAPPVINLQMIFTALDSMAVSLPFILGSTVILFAQVAPTAMGAGFLPPSWASLG